MARVAITEQYLTDIANAIRSKTGGSATYLPSEMAQAILTISGSGGITPTGTLSITENGTYNVTQYASASVSVPVGTTINNQDKSVTPTTSQQTITADNGYTGLGTITVAAMPTGTTTAPTSITETGASISRSGTTLTLSKTVSVTPRVTTAGYVSSGTAGNSSVSLSATDSNFVASNIKKNVAIFGLTGTYEGSGSGGTTPIIESLSITPSETAQTFESSSVDGYKPVTVSAISSTYVGSGITQRSSTDLTASGATVTVPVGYYSAQATKSVASGSATGPTSLSGSSASVSTGTNTLTLTKTGVTTTPTVSAGYIGSATASTATVTLTASVTTKAAATITPGTTNQTIASGTYLTGTQTISGDSNLVAGNIVSGKSIFGVSGSVVIQHVYKGSSAPSSSTGSNGDIYLQS